LLSIVTLADEAASTVLRNGCTSEDVCKECLR
jgi:hypothetical protein